MSCYSCTKSFSLLRKEKGCPSCGFSYCSKCLDNKIFLPKLNTETKVCAKCKKNEIKPDEPKIFAAPDAYYRRTGVMEENKSIQPMTNRSTSSTDPIDKQIFQRLEKLREDRNLTCTSTSKDDNIEKRLQNIKGETASTSDADLYTRLAKLKGVPLDVVTRKAIIPPPDTRTEQEQANDLIKQYVEQTNIDTKYKDEFDSLISNMESRILKLKESNPVPKSSLTIQENDESESEEDSVHNIVEMDILREFIPQSHHIIENKRTASSNIKKAQEWKYLARKSYDNVKLAWKRMKLAVKGNLSSHSQCLMRTGGGEKPKSPSQEDLAIMAIAPHDFVVEYNDYASDAINTMVELNPPEDNEITVGPSTDSPIIISPESSVVAEVIMDQGTSKVNVGNTSRKNENIYRKKCPQNIKETTLESNTQFKKKQLDMIKVEHQYKVKIAQLKIKKLELEIELLENKKS